MSNYTKDNLIAIPPTAVPAGTLAMKVGDKIFTPGNIRISSGSMDFYKCASVDTTAKTWTGYLAVLTDGVYTFEETVTDGLSYGDTLTPVIGYVYDSSATLQVKIPVDGLLYYNPLTDLHANGWVVGTVSNETVSGIPCALFSTQKSYIANTVKVSQSTAISISLWIYLESGAGTQGGYYPRFFCIGIPENIDDSHEWLCFTYDYRENVFTWQGPDNNNWTTVSMSAIKDTWVNFVCVCDNNELRLYVNSVLQGNATLINALALPELSTLYINHIGRTGFNDFFGVDGVRMAQFRVFDKVLTQDEITALANEFTPTA